MLVIFKNTQLQHRLLFAFHYKTPAMAKQKIKLVPVTDQRNTVTVIDNLTILEVNKPATHKTRAFDRRGRSISVFIPIK
jgi:hypothetical protein